MGDRWTRLAVVGASTAVMAYAMAGCGGGESAKAHVGQPRIVGPGLGLSEWSDDGPGDRRVVRVSDAEAASSNPAERTVTALVEICAPHQRTESPAAADWQVVLDQGGTAPAEGSPHPTTDGAPALPASGRIAAGDCAFADVDFAVPAGSVTIGMLYRTAAGGSVRWTWERSDTVPGEAS